MKISFLFISGNNKSKHYGFTLFMFVLFFFFLLRFLIISSVKSEMLYSIDTNIILCEQ